VLDIPVSRGYEIISTPSSIRSCRAGCSRSFSNAHESIASDRRRCVCSGRADKGRASNLRRQQSRVRLFERGAVFLRKDARLAARLPALRWGAMPEWGLRRRPISSTWSM
jgi:hypothetical protein